jgi:multiple sugar transport system permease protein
MRETGLTRILMAAPAQVLVLACIVLPSAWLLWLSLQDATFGRATAFVGMANYARVVADPYFWRSMGNTAIVVLVVVHVELVLGLLMALLFASGVPFRPFMLAVVLAPYAVSEVSAVVIWRFLFDTDVGPFAQAIPALGDWAADPAAGLALVCLLSVWLHLPFTFMILYAARLALPAELYEAARIDGATKLQAFRRVTLPLLTPPILVAMLFRLVFAFRLFSEVWLLTGGGPARTTEVVGVYLYLEAFRYDAFGVASATGWIMVVGSFLLASPYLWRLYRQQADA